MWGVAPQPSGRERGVNAEVSSLLALADGINRQRADMRPSPSGKGLIVDTAGHRIGSPPISWQGSLPDQAKGLLQRHREGDCESS